MTRPRSSSDAAACPARGASGCSLAAAAAAASPLPSPSGDGGSSCGGGSSPSLSSAQRSLHSAAPRALRRVTPASSSSVSLGAFGSVVSSAAAAAAASSLRRSQKGEKAPLGAPLLPSSMPVAPLKEKGRWNQRRYSTARSAGADGATSPAAA